MQKVDFPAQRFGLGFEEAYALVLRRGTARLRIAAVHQRESAVAMRARQ